MELAVHVFELVEFDIITTKRDFVVQDIKPGRRFFGQVHSELLRFCGQSVFENAVPDLSGKIEEGR